MAERRRPVPVPVGKAATTRIPVRKTYKLYVGGEFPRSESGRSYLVRGADGAPVANAVRSSRKDLRDAIRTARGAFPAWAGKTAMNRGQVLYRVAELMEGRRVQFADEVAVAEGLSAAKAAAIGRPSDRSVGLVRRLGGQDQPGAGHSQPGRRALLRLHDSRSRQASWALSPRRALRCSAWCLASRRPSSAATRSWFSPRKAGPYRPSRWARYWPRVTCQPASSMS